MLSSPAPARSFTSSIKLSNRRAYRWLGMQQLIIRSDDYALAPPSTVDVSASAGNLPDSSPESCYRPNDKKHDGEETASEHQQFCPDRPA